MLRTVTKIITCMTAFAAMAAAQVPIAPVLAYPADGAKDVSVYATLKWKKTAGAVTYHVQIATDLAFTAPLFLEDSAVADTAIKMNKFADSTSYYWKVRAKGAGGYGPFSKTRLLTSTPPLGLGPVLTAPADYAGDIPTSVDLAWEAFPGATGYHVQISTETNFATILKEDVAVKATTWKIDGLKEGTQYFWHVRALSPDFPGDKTAWTKARFLTVSAVGILARHGRSLKAASPRASTRTVPSTDLNGRTLVDRGEGFYILRRP